MIDPSSEFQTLQSNPQNSTLPQQAQPHQMVNPMQAHAQAQGLQTPGGQFANRLAQNASSMMRPVNGMGQRTTMPVPNQMNRSVPQPQMNRPVPQQMNRMAPRVPGQAQTMQQGFHPQQAQPIPQAQGGVLSRPQFGNQAGRTPVNGAVGAGQHEPTPIPGQQGGSPMQAQSELDH